MSSFCEPISAFTSSSPSFLSSFYKTFSLGRESEEKRDCCFACLILVVMDDSKRAAKAFVDQFFPVKESNSKSTDAFRDLFSSPNPKKGSPKKHEHGSHSFSAQIPFPDGKYQGYRNKNHSASQKGSNSTQHCEISEPCLMSSSIDYGCRDNYPYNPDNRYPGPSYCVEKKDRKDGSDYTNPEVAGAEWWQGSFYY